MKVNRRSASSPSLLLEASEPPSVSTSVGLRTNYYQFQLEAHHVEKGKRGQKVFVCDLCRSSAGIFKRSFSLKRHYLRFHINFAFLSPRDLNNCAIAPAGQQSRSGYNPAASIIDGLSNSSSSSSSGSSRLIYRCHQCGCLLRTKNDLLKHLDTHRQNPASGTDEVLDGDRGSSNRCPRCSTAFSLRKTLMRHLKKNRCRGGSTGSTQSTKTESETSVQYPEEPVPFDCRRLADDESQEEIEASLKEGSSATSLFRFACTLCAKMFNSYVNMCRHRRLAHGRYGICSPHWLSSRKTTAQPVVTTGHLQGQSLENASNLSHIVQNANDNLSRYLDGKQTHIHSIVSAEDSFDIPDASDPPPERWSWTDASFNQQELQKLDIPLQMAYDRGLQLWNLQETAKIQDHSSQEDQQVIKNDISSALNLQKRPAADDVAPSTAATVQFSGEWTRSKIYICSPCGRIYDDYLVLLDHQQSDHSSVWCSHIQLDPASDRTGLAAELTRQIQRSGSAGSADGSSSAFQCTKCRFDVQSTAELHSHILLCSNHVSTSPSRKRKNLKSNSRRNHWRNRGNNEFNNTGRSRGMQRSISSQTKTSSGTRSLRSRSPKDEMLNGEDAASNALRRSTRRVLSFPDQPSLKKKKSAAPKRILRQRSLPAPPVTVTPSKSPKKKVVKSPLLETSDTYECDGCHKQFQSHTSVLKHKHYCPNKSNVDVKISNSLPQAAAVPPINGKAKGKTVPAAQIERPKSKTPVPLKKSNQNNLKQQNKLKKAKSKRDKVKTERVEEPELVSAGSSGRPIRASRKSSATLVMEDQVEASFLEALSPEQRLRVADQRCPFCSKHYVYRSNFKKHLIEGCDTSDTNESESASITPIPEPTKVNGKRTRTNESVVIKKEKVEVKKKNSIKNDNSKAVPNGNAAATKGKAVQNGRQIKKEPKKKTKKVAEDSASRGSRSKTNKMMETRTKLSQDVGKKKNVPSVTKDSGIAKRKDVKKKANASSKPKEPVPSKIKKLKSTKGVTGDSQEEIITSDLVNGSASNANADTTKGVLMDVWKNEQQDSTEGNKTCCHADNLVTDTRLDRELGWEVPKVSASLDTKPSDEKPQMSHALDKFYFGKALDDAIRTGIFKSYANLTKYPAEMQQLKAMAQAYCQQSKTNDGTW